MSRAMAAAAASIASALVVAVLATPTPSGSRLLGIVGRPANAVPRARSLRVGRPVRLAVAAAVAAAAVAPGLLWLPAGLVTFGVALRWSRRRAGQDTAVDDALRDSGPLVCDLLAAALSAGSPVESALRLVAAGTPLPVRHLLGDVASSLALGASPEEAWAPVGRAPPLRPVARAAVRSAASGAALAATLTQVADELRDASYAAGQEAARRAGVQVVAPLTLCFLPAFVLLGVVPLVAGLFATLPP